MASLIPCPHCGPRPKEEFTVRGAVLPRPAPDAPVEEGQAHVYLRANPRGDYAEHWHHSGGCRRWLVVNRNTATHAVHSVTDAAGERP